MVTVQGASVSNLWWEIHKQVMAGNSTFLWFLCLTTNVIASFTSCVLCSIKHNLVICYICNTFVLGDITFNCDFIVCRPLILGRNFLIQNHISVRYSENGKCILDHKQQELIASVCAETKPQLSLGNSMTLPGRTLAVVHVNNNLKPKQSGKLYEVDPNYLLNNEYPNLCVIPMIHNVDVHKTENVLLVVVNFLTDSVYLSKGEIMGFMQSQSLDISEIKTETSTEPSPIFIGRG